MNGSEANIFITTTPGIDSVTSLLQELPLPTPLPFRSDQNLLSHLNDTDKAFKLLKSQKSPLILPLVAALSSANVDNIVLKKENSKNLQCGQSSLFIHYLLEHNHTLFKDSVTFSVSSISASESQNSNLHNDLNHPSSEKSNNFLEQSLDGSYIQADEISDQVLNNSCSGNLEIECSQSSLSPDSQIFHSLDEVRKESSSFNVNHSFSSCSQEGNTDLISESERKDDNSENQHVMNSVEMASEEILNPFPFTTRVIHSEDAFVPPQLVQDLPEREISAEYSMLSKNSTPLSTARTSNVISSGSSKGCEIVRESKLKCKTGSGNAGKSDLTEIPLVVMLTKLSLEDQLLAQKSVSEFLKKQTETSFTVLPKLPTENVFKSPLQSMMEQVLTSPYKHYNFENFSNHENSELIRQGVPIGTLYSSSSTKLKSSSHTRRSTKREHLEAFANESSDCEDEESGKSFIVETEAESVVVPVSKIKKQKKKTRKDSSYKHLSVEDLMNSHAYQHFSRIVDSIFDYTEDIDFAILTAEDAECPEEVLIPLAQLHELRNEAAKLKEYRVMNQLPTARLVRLLAILARNIMDGAELLPLQSIEVEPEEQEALLLTKDRVMRSADATLTTLYILTSPEMPKNVFLDEIIEQIVLFLKNQSQNTIFPIFDPVYSHEKVSKSNSASNVKRRRTNIPKGREKYLLQLYNKINEALSLLVELLESHTLIDTIVLQASMLGVCPFFVEGIDQLQLNALRLVTTIFALYDKHRELILEDLLTSIAKLPTSKRNLRNYKLNSEESIQMFTALVIQLIQSVVRLPEPEVIDLTLEFLLYAKSTKEIEKGNKNKYEKDSIITSYEAAVNTAVNFLSAFLEKCRTKKDEMDFRLLFENFAQDLLITVIKPEWPASILLLSVLGRILIKKLTDESTEMALKISALDYIGVITARLRKHAMANCSREDIIHDVIQRMSADSNLTTLENSESGECDEILCLQKAILQYLDTRVANDPALRSARRFYIAKWYKEAVVDTSGLEQSFISPDLKSPEASRFGSVEKNMSKPNQSNIIHNSSPRHINQEKGMEENNEEPYLENCKDDAIELAKERGKFFLAIIKQQEPLKIKESIDCETAEIISQYLTFTKHFSKCCESYLSHILKALSDTAVTVRVKTVKCLALILEADPSILIQPDIQKCVHGRLLDSSTSVREAAVDILGKYILSCPELISYYYEMLTARILDTGLSVRKKVIKILRDICVEHSDFPKIPEICVKILRRINDEDSISMLVKDVFHHMWFRPILDKEKERIFQKVKNITYVVEACRESGLEWFEQLLTNLLKDREDSNYKSVVESCKQIVDCLVENLLQQEEASQNIKGGCSSNLLACLEALHLFSKVHPTFVVPYATTIQPYINIKCNSQIEFLLLRKVVQILELVVPLMKHPSESFLAQTEEELIKFILQKDMRLIPNCMSCLRAIVNNVTNNNKLIKDCYKKYSNFLLACKKEYESNPENEFFKSMKPKLIRPLYLIGLFHCHFDLDAMNSDCGQNDKISPTEGTLSTIIFYNQLNDEDIKLKALTSLGYLLVRHCEFMFRSEIKTLYQHLLTSPNISSVFKCQVLKNFFNFLKEEETRMTEKEVAWNKTSKSENLKEMCDVDSGMASAVIQMYLKEILECVLHSDVTVRKASLSVIQLILEQGLVHPVPIVPYLVCLGSDDESIIQINAGQLLQDIDKRYPGFILMKAMLGVRMSYKMHQLIQNQQEIIRGFRSAETPVSRTNCLYSVLRSARQSRRAFMMSLLKLFDEELQTPLSELLYVADNIAYFLYMVQDEPLYIINHLDLMVSLSGFSVLQTFRESLLSTEDIAEVNDHDYIKHSDHDKDGIDDDFTDILARLPDDTAALQECIISSQGCMLLLYLKQTLKEMYGLTESKIQQYSPCEVAKVYERPLNRNSQVRFHPEQVLNFLKNENFQYLSREKLVPQFLHFRNLMLSLDPPDKDDDNEMETSTLTASPSPSRCTQEKSVAQEDGARKSSQSPMQEAEIDVTQMPMIPTSSRRQKPPKKVPTEKTKGKSIKKRKRPCRSESDGSDDPDFVL